jgi:hypothetical protein
MQTSSIVAELDFDLECFVRGFWQVRWTSRWLLATALMMASVRLSFAQTVAASRVISTGIQHDGYPESGSSLASVSGSAVQGATEDLNSCRVHQVKSLPGSHQFGSEFIVAMTSDPDPNAKEPNAVWALTADLSKQVPVADRAMYISKSSDGGVTWTEIARIESDYFDAKIGEGLRNGLGVSPGGSELVFTTQRGAFQVLPGAGPSDASVKYIAGPRVPRPRPRLSKPKKPGDPIMAGAVLITADGKHMVIGYGYFDLNPRILAYHKDDGGSWAEDRPLPNLPSNLDILSMQYDDSRSSRPRSLYLGTGDQAYRLNFQTMRWNRIAGVGDDSAIHAMSIVGGPHLAACWGVYNPLSADAVKRVTDARFLLHRGKDEVGSNIRAYGIEVDAARPNREVVTSITGAYVSEDSGKTWRRLNDLPDGEYRSSHFNPDGSIILSGIPGTFLANPFSDACSPRLQTRER